MAGLPDAQPSCNVLSAAPTYVVGNEPDLSFVCTNESDKMILRNIIYTIWATNKHAGTNSANCYLVCFIKSSRMAHFVLSEIKNIFSLPLRSSASCYLVCFIKSSRMAHFVFFLNEIKNIFSLPLRSVVRAHQVILLDAVHAC
jgi:hypothetical protein